jgi:hypothetical protein
VNVENEPFFTYPKFLQTMLSLKSKKCHGCDKVPLLVLKDGAEVLASPFTERFKKIYQTKQLPDQWKILQALPLFKNGNKRNINSYRPISNLCLASKIFERLMLSRLTDIEALSNINLTGKVQYRFKKGKSTVTALKEIQSQIATKIDQGQYVAMGSLDLLAAFEVVNVDLLTQRLSILGLPTDWMSLLELWLTNQCSTTSTLEQCNVPYLVRCFSVCLSPGF